MLFKMPCPLLHLQTPKIQYSCHCDSAGRPNAECRPCRGTLYLGALQQVFFLKHVV